MKFIDDFLNSITMYKLVMWGLSILAGVAIILSFFGAISFSPVSLITSLAILSISCQVLNIIFAKIFRAHRNVESAYISALILFFILAPSIQLKDIGVLILVSLLAIASKYILAIYKKHIFNPVAISLVIIDLFGSGMAIWWVATPWMLLPVAILGFLIIKKIKRFSLFLSFALTALVVIMASQLYSSGFSSAFLWKDFKLVLFSWPVLFFGAIMLTEPTTTPPRQYMQVIYGFIVGLFFSIQFNIGTLFASPELALVIGNLFSYMASPKKRLVLTLKEKNKLSDDVYDFVFLSSEPILFRAGQYLEWTLEHLKPDTRGDRRYFTIASSPTEQYVRLGVKTFEKPSSFKQALIALNPGETMSASQLAGEFTLPNNRQQKLVFIAGGIGITPFRSMIKYLMDKNDRRDIVILYSNKKAKDIVYKEIFDRALETLGIKTIYAVTAENSLVQYPLVGSMINPDMIAKEVPDYKERHFYISGPHGMVTAFEETLQKMGIKKSHIKTDLFPGFA